MPIYGHPRRAGFLLAILGLAGIAFVGTAHATSVVIDDFSQATTLIIEAPTGIGTPTANNPNFGEQTGPSSSIFGGLRTIKINRLSTSNPPAVGGTGKTAVSIGDTTNTMDWDNGGSNGGIAVLQYLGNSTTTINGRYTNETISDTIAPTRFVNSAGALTAAGYYGNIQTCLISTDCGIDTDAGMAGLQGVDISGMDYFYAEYLTQDVAGIIASVALWSIDGGGNLLRAEHTFTKDAADVQNGVASHSSFFTDPFVGGTANSGWLYSDITANAASSYAAFDFMNIVGLQIFLATKAGAQDLSIDLVEFRAVPEPASLALLGVGLLALGAARRLGKRA